MAEPITSGRWLDGQPMDPAAGKWPVYIGGREGREVKTYAWLPRVHRDRAAVCVGVARYGARRAEVAATLDPDSARELARALIEAADEAERHAKGRGA